MNRRTTVPILLACAFALLAPPPAFADYVGLEVVDRKGNPSICQDPSEPEIPYKLEVCDIYAVFDDSADRLISVAFSNVSTTDPNGFYQHSQNFVNTAPACALIALEPTAECDSFVTLGEECADADASTLDPDFDSTKFNSSGEVSGGWYNSAPSNGQGAPDANGRVLIGRFSYKQNKNTTGDVCIFTQLAGSDDIVEFLLVPFDCSVPGGGLPASGPPPPGTFFVDDDCTPPTDGSASDPFCTIQEGIDETEPDNGDIVEVAPGIYMESINFGTKKITLRSSGGQAVTTIDATGLMTRVVTCIGLQGLETVLDGFTITGGEVTDDPDGGAGMLIKDSDPTIINCTFTGNHTLGVAPQPPGAGMYLSGSNAEITDCTFSNNHSNGGAGGLCNNFGSKPTISNCTFTGNFAENGGGMGNRNGSDATVTNCTFTDNHAIVIVGASQGGGMYNNGSNPIVTGCSFIRCTALYGGGMANAASDPKMINCTFTGNSALDSGGAMFNKDDLGVSSDVTLTNCLFIGNSAELAGGGAIVHAYASNATVTNCTFSANEAPWGGAIRTTHTSTMVLNNTVLWGGNAGFEGDEIDMAFGTTVEVDYCDVKGGETGITGIGHLIWGAGNIGEEPVEHDPGFAQVPDPGVDGDWGTTDDDYGDLRLTAGSPCLDRADNTAVPADLADLNDNGDTIERTPVDFDLLRRFVNDPNAEPDLGVPDPPQYPDVVDMGAYEFNPCPWDLDNNGTVGAFDLAQLLGAWGPSTCPPYPDPDFRLDCDVGPFDLALLLGNWGACP